jgi:hypothetical protein
MGFQAAKNFCAQPFYDRRFTDKNPPRLLTDIGLIPGRWDADHLETVTRLAPRRYISNQAIIGVHGSQSAPDPDVDSMYVVRLWNLPLFVDCCATEAVP